MFEDDYYNNLRQYNLFISHNGEGDEEYLEFIRRLVEASDFEWKDHGIPNKNSQDELRQQINNSDIVIILSGLYSKHHDLIKNQVDLALQLNKPIILIRPYGLEEVPAELEKVAKGVVGWNRVCIVEMIQESLEEE
ncbi:MAG TPA: hypothetical protein GX531_02510 [Methanothermobacter sp.]|nr:hypothetical protein [Methanothermobacter sp.]